MRNRGPLRRLIALAEACRLNDRVVSVWMLRQTSSALMSLFAREASTSSAGIGAGAALQAVRKTVRAPTNLRNCMLRE